jgi:hypothetical protein
MSPLVPDPSNPDDESEFMLKFDSEDTIDAFIDAYAESGWRSKDEGIQRFAERLTVPVGEWTACPMCGSEFSQRVEHAARCTSCGGLYADDFWSPTIEDDDTEYGCLVGVTERLWYADERSVLSGSVRPWITGRVSGALVPVPNGELERRVRCRAGAEQLPPPGDSAEDEGHTQGARRSPSPKRPGDGSLWSVNELPFAAVPPRPEALRVLLEASDEDRRYAIGDVIDSAAAKSKVLDRRALDFYESHYGTPPRDATFLEAELIVTTVGLFYVTPKASSVWSRGWDQVTVRVTMTGRKFARIVVARREGGDEVEFRIGARACANLRAAAEEHGALR